jgi:diketogulonate reductase-like aldo/keto reductase
MATRKLSRRQFNLGCAAFGLSFATLSARLAARATAEAPGQGEPSPARAAAVRLPDGTAVPPLGQGCWHLGQGRHPLDVELEALRTGLAGGMTLIDTSGNYGHGRSEQVLKSVLAGGREHIFLVSKVEAGQVSGDGIARACAASLARLGTAYLDLYLMHWPVSTSDFAHMVAAFEQLRADGKIRRWGVSNFSRSQMEDLFRVPDGSRCATNQVPYSLNNRDIERDLLPWCTGHELPVMAYSPLGGEGNLVVGNSTLAQVAASHGCSAAAIALAWVIRGGNVIAIPESGSPAHVRENASALAIRLTPRDLEILDKAFPGPRA